MRIGTIAVRDKLPPTATDVTDKQIQESLWHYYYDIEKSAEYLVNMYMKKPKEKVQKKEKKVAGGLISSCGCTDMELHLIGRRGVSTVGGGSTLYRQMQRFSGVLC
jgi:hypothetical protein